MFPYTLTLFTPVLCMPRCKPKLIQDVYVFNISLCIDLYQRFFFTRDVARDVEMILWASNDRIFFQANQVYFTKLSMCYISEIPWTLRNMLKAGATGFNLNIYKNQVCFIFFFLFHFVYFLPLHKIGYYDKGWHNLCPVSIKLKFNINVKCFNT